MKIFLSADIEGTTGITLWDETENGHARYPYFQNQMTKEVNAACLGAMEGGCNEILVKDAHDSACNIIPEMLPEEVRIFRGWGTDIMSMMAGLEKGYDGVIFTGYHSAAGMNTNPLAHTMNTRNNYVKINGIICPELMLNSLTASYLGVPVRLVTGDKGLCDWMKEMNPNIETVAVSEGCGRGSISIHPKKALRLIQKQQSVLWRNLQRIVCSRYRNILRWKSLSRIISRQRQQQLIPVSFRLALLPLNTWLMIIWKCFG